VTEDTKKNNWTPKGEISKKLFNGAARMRLLADKLSGEDRVEANAIASAVMAETQRVDGLELAIIN